MAKLTLDDVINDLNFLDDEWTICAKWPWTANSEACVARTAADIRAAEARGLESFMDVAMARDLVEGMDPDTWMSHLIYHAEHRFSGNAAARCDRHRRKRNLTNDSEQPSFTSVGAALPT